MRVFSLLLLGSGLVGLGCAYPPITAKVSRTTWTAPDNSKYKDAQLDLLNGVSPLSVELEESQNPYPVANWDWNYEELLDDSNPALSVETSLPSSVQSWVKQLSKPQQTHVQQASSSSSSESTSSQVSSSDEDLENRYQNQRETSDPTDSSLYTPSQRSYAPPSSRLSEQYRESWPENAQRDQQPSNDQPDYMDWATEVVPKLSLKISPQATSGSQEDSQERDLRDRTARSSSSSSSSSEEGVQNPQPYSSSSEESSEKRLRPQPMWTYHSRPQGKYPGSTVTNEVRRPRNPNAYSQWGEVRNARGQRNPVWEDRDRVRPYIRITPADIIMAILNSRT